MYAKASFSVEELKSWDSAMVGCASFTSIPLAKTLWFTRAIVPVRMLVHWYIHFDLLNISFKSKEGSVSDSPEQMTSCFPLDLLGVVHGPTIFEVTSGYWKDFFLRERRLLDELKTEAADSRLNTDGLLI